MHPHSIRWAIALVLAGCGLSQSPPQNPPTGDPDRKALTQEQCGAQGGSVVGDIGDGATHRADYVCANGKSPLGDIVQPTGGPFGVEGAVCCPR